MKRVLASILVLTLTIGFVGCGGKEKPKSSGGAAPAAGDATKK